MIEFKIENEEAKAIIQLLDSQPTQSNAWPLVQRLKAQFAEQTKDEQTAESVDPVDENY